MPIGRRGQVVDGGRRPFSGRRDHSALLRDLQGRAATTGAMRAAGIRPALIDAYERTGLSVSSENRKLMSAADLDEWTTRSPSLRARTHND
jgi:hypothetical protein